MRVNRKKLGQLIKRRGKEKGELIPLLQDIQAEYNYLPPEVLLIVSEELNVSLSQIYHVATFFKAFHLEPQGRHLIKVCLGTACHVRGAVMITDKLKRDLGLEAGETTKDQQFTLETVNCLGACALGPIMVVDGEYFGQMTSAKVGSVLKKYS
jgi:NADH-quinone oxidoreductase subunit E